MLDKFSISNFKAFGAEQVIPIRPITLVFGANSSGKSTILQSLILAHHAAVEEKFDLDARRTVIGGDSVDLGGFHQYVHRCDSKRVVTLGFDLKVPNGHLFSSPLLRAHNPSTAKVRVEFRMGLSAATGKPQLLGYEAEVGGINLFQMSSSGQRSMRVQWNNEHSISQSLFDEVKLTTKWGTDQKHRKLFDECVASMLETLLVDGDALPPHQFVDCAILNEQSKIDPRLLLDRNAESDDSIRRVIELFFYRSLVEILADLHFLFTDTIGALEYLGPLRKLPRRSLDDDDIDEEERGSGAFAWSRVKHDSEVRDRVNESLRSLKIDYRLEARRLFHEDALRKVGARCIEEAYQASITEIVREQRWGEIEDLFDASPESYSAYLSGHPDLHESLADMFRMVHQDALRENGQEDEADQFSMDDAKDWVLDSVDGDYGDYRDEIFEHYLENSEQLREFVSRQIDSKAIVDRIVGAVIHEDPNHPIKLSIVGLSNGISLTHRDIGVGISQILPVLVHAYAEKNKLIAIEQPEIHLHPALQAELGDVFIESALGKNRNKFLLETHSEHLILRLLRRIRETTEGELEDGQLPLRPEDVCILYVQPGSEGSEVLELPINADGDFDNPWPNGFFDERVDELF